MTIPAAYAITANSLTAETFRQAPSSLIGGTGVVQLNGGDLAVAQHGTPNMSVDVAAGQVWIPGTLASTAGFPTNFNAQAAFGLPSAFNEQGCYYCWNNATVNLAIAAADPTNPRIDLICASIQDAQYSGSNNQPVLQVITGTPAPSPSVPSAPDATVVLAQIAVAAGAGSIVTANITDKRPKLGLKPPSHPYHAEMYRNAALSQATATIPFDTVPAGTDPSGMCTTGASAKFTVPVSGIYRLTAVANVTTVNGDQFYLTVTQAGSASLTWNLSGMVAGGATGIPVGGGAAIPCVAGDTLTVTSHSPVSVVYGVGRGATYATCVLEVAT